MRARKKTIEKITKKKMMMIKAILIPPMLMMIIRRRLSQAHTLQLGHRVTGSISIPLFSIIYVLTTKFLFSQFGPRFDILCVLGNVCRQSIDLYSSVPSPNIGFLGNNSVTRFGSSFLSSSLIRRHTPESLPAVTKPLLEADEQALPPPPKHRLSSHGLLSPAPSRRGSMRKDEKVSMVSHEIPMSRNSSYGQAVLNGEFILP